MKETINEMIINFKLWIHSVTSRTYINWRFEVRKSADGYVLVYDRKWGTNTAYKSRFTGYASIAYHKLTRGPNPLY